MYHMLLGIYTAACCTQINEWWKSIRADWKHEEYATDINICKGSTSNTLIIMSI